MTKRSIFSFDKATEVSVKGACATGSGLKAGHKAQGSFTIKGEAQNGKASACKLRKQQAHSGSVNNGKRRCESGRIGQGKTTLSFA